MKLRKSGVVILQDRDGTTINHQMSQIARCSVPIAAKRIHTELYDKTLAVHCENTNLEKKKEERFFVTFEQRISYKGIYSPL